MTDIYVGGDDNLSSEEKYYYTEADIIVPEGSKLTKAEIAAAKNRGVAEGIAELRSNDLGSFKATKQAHLALKK